MISSFQILLWLLRPKPMWLPLRSVFIFRQSLSSTFTQLSVHNFNISFFTFFILCVVVVIYHLPLYLPCNWVSTTLYLCFLQYLIIGFKLNSLIHHVLHTTYTSCACVVVYHTAFIACIHSFLNPNPLIHYLYVIQTFGHCFLNRNQSCIMFSSPITVH